MSRFFAAPILLALVLLSALGRADNSKAALESFKAAQSRYEARDFAGALEAAKKAVDLSGSPNARLYVGRSLRELGRLSEAHFELERTLKEARDLAADKDAKYEATRDAAAAELALLDQKVGKIIVALVDAPDKTSVTLNGTPLDASRIGKPVAVDPGDLLIRAQPPGGTVMEKSIQLAAGETETVTLVLGGKAGDEPESTAPPAVVTQDEPVKTKGGSLRTVGFVVAGVGVVGIAVFGIAGSMSSSKFDEVESGCGSQRCTDPKYADTIDSGKRLETIANVGLVVGGVSLLAGGAMILFGGPSAEKSGTASVDVRPGVFQLGYARHF